MTTLNVKVAQSPDDGNYYSSSFYLDKSSTDNRFGFEGSNQLWVGHFLRFQLNIPQGATINSARLEFIASATELGTTVNVRIKAADEDNAASPSDYSDAVTRTRTTAFTDWFNIEAWGNNTQYNSPDISDIIQEIVDRPGWTSGNYIVIFVDDNGTVVTSGTARRRAKSYDNVTTEAPNLFVDYTDSGGAQPIGQVSEIDATQNIGRSKSKTIAQSLELDTSSAIERQKSKLILLNTETDSASTFDRQKSRAILIATELDEPIGLETNKSYLISVVIEINSAQSFGSNQDDQLGQVLEIDEALPFGRIKSISIQQVSEIDIAQQLVVFVDILNGLIVMIEADYRIDLNYEDYRISLMEE